MVRGAADLHTYDEGWRRVVARDGVGFVTRVVVRRPSDAAAASGDVLVEPLHPAGDMAAAWPRLGTVLVRSGWSWVGVTQDVAGLAALRAAHPERCAALDIPEAGLGFDIVAQAVRWLRSGGLPDLRLDHLFMSGASYTGTFQRVFLGEGFHAAARRPGGEPAVEGYLILISSGGFRLGGYHPLSAASGVVPGGDPRRTIQPRDVPVIELLSEGEAETNRSSRRPDSDEPGDRYRLYEVPGACHMSPGERGTLGRLPDPVEEPSDFPLYALAGAALANLRAWAVDGVAPPRAPRIELLDDRDAGPHGAAPEALPPARDEHGNARGGVRTPHLDVPVATYSPRSTLAVDDARVGPPGRRPVALGELIGSMRRFPPDRLRALYGTPERYLADYRAGVDALVANRWVLPPDAEQMVADAAGVTF
ncbi:MAG TPA: alpha/beta hydrolase domain-containing protein [Acidimicrobiales bacterium]|nr:alpha/beta hydrolase domain-containing protein [Acidimicrobiales bacterium]